MKNPDEKEDPLPQLIADLLNCQKEELREETILLIKCAQFAQRGGTDWLEHFHSASSSELLAETGRTEAETKRK